MTIALLSRMTLYATMAATLLVGAHGPAAAGAPRADATARAEALGARAQTAYRADDFDRAIELYIEAYETAASPGFLFNIAFIYDRKLGDAELARDYYQRVVSFPGADAEMVARARARLVELEATPRLPRPVQPDPPVRPDAPPDPPPKPAPSRGGPPAGPMALVIGGGAFFAAGVVTGIVAAITESDFHAEEDLLRRRDLQSAGRTQALVADVLMVTGVVAAGVGAVLWLLDDGGGEPDASVHVAPGVRFDAAVVPGGAMLTFGGSL